MTTEKRFTITDDGIVDNLSKKQYTKIKSNDDILDSISFTNLIEVVECLNAFHEENKELKFTVEYLKSQLKNYSEVCPEGKWILNQGDLDD